MYGKKKFTTPYNVHRRLSDRSEVIAGHSCDHSTASTAQRCAKPLKSSSRLYSHGCADRIHSHDRQISHGPGRDGADAALESLSRISPRPVQTEFRRRAGGTPTPSAPTSRRDCRRLEPFILVLMRVAKTARNVAAVADRRIGFEDSSALGKVGLFKSVAAVARGAASKSNQGVGSPPLTACRRVPSCQMRAQHGERPFPSDWQEDRSHALPNGS